MMKKIKHLSVSFELFDYGRMAAVCLEFRVGNYSYRRAMRKHRDPFTKDNESRYGIPVKEKEELLYMANKYLLPKFMRHIGAA